MRESSKRRKTRSSPIYPLSRCRSSLIEKEAMALVKGMTAGACVPNSGMYPCFRWLSYSDGFVSCKISAAITSPDVTLHSNRGKCTMRPRYCNQIADRVDGSGRHIIQRYAPGGLARHLPLLPLLHSNRVANVVRDFTTNVRYLSAMALQ